MSDSNMVSLAGVCKGFGVGDTRVDVLKDLDIDIEKGQMLAVVGPSGAVSYTHLRAHETSSSISYAVCCL